MASFIDANGARQQLNPEVEWYRRAGDAGMSLAQWVNQEFPTSPDQHLGTTYQQLLMSEGICLRPNRTAGIRSTSMKDMLDGRPEVQAGGAIVRDSGFASAALRTLFPSAILTAIEDRLIADLNMNADAFDSLVAIDDTISGDKFERPLLNYSNVNQRSQAIGQLAEPAAMMTITTSSVARTIPALSIGLTISDQAKAATTLDLVSMAMARQFALERNARANEFLLAMLSGDTDMAQASLSSLSLTVAASALDTTASSGLTQKAWMKWLYRNSKKRKIDWVVTDIDGALAIENRTGKPTNVTDNPNSVRIDSVLEVGNPTWNANVKVFITDDPNWPAKTIMGLDSRYGVHRVSSSTIAYQAVEAFVLRRMTSLRVDMGEVAYRLYDDAFDTLTYA